MDKPPTILSRTLVIRAQNLPTSSKTYRKIMQLLRNSRPPDSQSLSRPKELVNLPSSNRISSKTLATQDPKTGNHKVVNRKINKLRRSRQTNRNNHARARDLANLIESNRVNSRILVFNSSMVSDLKSNKPKVRILAFKLQISELRLKVNKPLAKLEVNRLKQQGKDCRRNDSNRLISQTLLEEQGKLSSLGSTDIVEAAQLMQIQRMPSQML